MYITWLCFGISQFKPHISSLLSDCPGTIEANDIGKEITWTHTHMTHNKHLTNLILLDMPAYQLQWYQFIEAEWRIP